METTLIFLLFFSFSCLVVCFVKAWHYTILLALVELAWVTLIAVYASLSFFFFDVALFYWALLLFLFSAAEVVLGFISFLLFARQEI
jgi:hypothetical protein